MPTPHLPEFRRRAVELARTGDKSISALAKSPGISQSCLSNWVRQADRDEGIRNDGSLTTAEKRELAELRRKTRQLELENEILKRAAVESTGENFNKVMFVAVATFTLGVVFVGGRVTAEGKNNPEASRRPDLDSSVGH